MARELKVSHTTAASNLYAVLRRASDDTVWNTADADFEAWDDANIADYDLPLTFRGGDEFSADLPSAIAIGTTLRIFYYKRAGATPALDDKPLVTRLQTWSGVALSAPTSSSKYLTLAEWRSLVRDSVLHVGSGAGYTALKVDRAIQFAGNFYVDQLKPTTTVATIDIDEGASTIDIPATYPDFRASDWVRGEIDYKPVEHVDYATVARRYFNAAPTGRPTAIAFRDKEATNGVLLPTADDDYTLRITYTPPFTDWTPGQADDTILLNIPKRRARDVAWFGASNALVYGETATGSIYASRGWQQFLDIIERHRSGNGSDPTDGYWDPSQYQ